MTTHKNEKRRRPRGGSGPPKTGAKKTYEKDPFCKTPQLNSLIGWGFIIALILSIFIIFGIFSAHATTTLSDNFANGNNWNSLHSISISGGVCTFAADSDCQMFGNTPYTASTYDIEFDWTPQISWSSQMMRIGFGGSLSGVNVEWFEGSGTNQATLYINNAAQGTVNLNAYKMTGGQTYRVRIASTAAGTKMYLNLKGSAEQQVASWGQTGISSKNVWFYSNYAPGVMDNFYYNDAGTKYSPDPTEYPWNITIVDSDSGEMIQDSWITIYDHTNSTTQSLNLTFGHVNKTFNVNENVTIWADSNNHQGVNGSWTNLSASYYNFAGGQLLIGLIEDGKGGVQVRAYDAGTGIGVITPTIMITDAYNNTWTATPDDGLADFICYLDRDLQIQVSATGYETQTRTVQLHDTINPPALFYMIPTGATPTDANNTYVYFTVRDTDTHEMIPGAQIQISNGGHYYTTFSGALRVEIPKGSYSYTVTHSQYDRVTGSFTANDISTVEIFMSSNGYVPGQEINRSFMKIYTDNINQTLQAMRDNANNTFGVEYGILDNMTVQINYIADNFTSVNGTVQGYTGTINAFGTLIRSIPGKVQFVFIYNLILLLCLVVLNR